MIRLLADALGMPGEAKPTERGACAGIQRPDLPLPAGEPVIHKPPHSAARSFEVRPDSADGADGPRAEPLEPDAGDLVLKDDELGEVLASPGVLEAGDLVLNDGELAEVLSAPGHSSTCFLRVLSTGAEVEAPVQHLMKTRSGGDSGAYPQRIWQEDSCAICLRPVSGGNCAEGCRRCEGFRYVHRECLHQLLQRRSCPAGHTMVQHGHGMRCDGCGDIARMGWSCPECSWSTCRPCAASSQRCPTCRAPIAAPGPTDWRQAGAAAGGQRAGTPGAADRRHASRSPRAWEQRLPRRVPRFATPRLVPGLTRRAAVPRAASGIAPFGAPDPWGHLGFFF